jgi:hypothetical protein
MLYTFSKNWSLYTGISFLTCVATTLPITRFGIALLILAYALYGAVNTFITFSKIEQENNAHDEKAMRWAIAFNSPDFLYLLVAVIAGIYLGVAH